MPPPQVVEWGVSGAIVLKNSALPCYSNNPGGGNGPLTHDDANPIGPPGAFGPYRVMHQIGVGVLGPVFRTYEPDGDRLVALKAFHLDLTPELSRTLADLLHEIGNRGDVHPALVIPIDAGLSDDIPYLAAEYVAAESLDVAIRHYAPAPVDTALPLIVQLADAVDTAHACGLTHGALHLRDVFVTPELARMTGFGVVPALERVGLRGPLRRPYTAPEQMSNGAWGPAADRFALAAIVYELLTGRRPAGTGDQLTERLTCVVGARGAERLGRLFASALAAVPTDRPASARLFADQLADAVGWTGAEAVREALATMALRETSDSQRTRVDVDDGAADGTADYNQGQGAPPPAGATVTEVEGAGMANSDRPDDTGKSELDWSERSLDRGEADELREPAAFTPRPVGPPPGFERPSGLERGVPTGDSQDASDLDRPLNQLLDDTLALGPEVNDSRPGAADASWDRALAAALAPDVAEVEPGDRGLSAGPAGGTMPRSGDKEPPPPPARFVSVQPSVAAVSSSPRGPIARDERGSYDGEDDDYQVVESEALDSPASGSYEPISLSDLSERLGDGQGAADDEDEYAASLDAGFAAAVGFSDQEDDDAVMVRGQAGSAVETPSAVSLPLGIDENYDYESDDDLDDDAYEESPAGVWPAASRRLPVGPLVLLALAVVGVAFAIGFGWLSGGTAGDAGSGEDSLAAGLESPAAVGTPALGGATPEREFSEGTIADASSPAALASTEPDVPERDVAAPAPPSGVPAEPEPPAPVTSPAPAAPPARTTAAAPVAAPVGRLLVRSTPPGAQVAVNGEPRGTTPLALSDLSYADYDLTLTFGGYESQNRRVTISADDPIAALDTRLAPVPVPETASVGVGSIFVDTRPTGAEVWLDQRLVGETPMLIPDVPTGSHHVEFKNDGYRDWATTVEVGSAPQTRVTASLDPAR